MISLIQATSSDLLSYWLSLCKDILASSVGTDVRSAIQIEDKSGVEGAGDEDDDREVTEKNWFVVCD